ncbi:MAG: cobalamin biosynthesis protein CobQ [Methanomassiliicoccales archaeon Mx-03]|nr:MAG: cobalamin biosynthesis protein CobQ [Methanomassiliicoccales archaeon Mx-03]
MDCIKKKVNEELKAGWIGPNLKCDYHPSHFSGQDCTFCYCPFYPCEDTDLGDFIVGRHGQKIWNCSDCLFIHRTPVVKFVLSEIERLGITEAGDPRFADILASAKERFFRTGRALMVVGATSDAGKSVTVAALCRILHRRGLLVAPFKSQNMSLNSKVTRSGSEIAMIQTLQATAAGLKNPDAHMNPILLKPKGDTVSQVMVLGQPYGDYNVTDYYGEFVPGPGREIVRENIEFLKKRYDVVLMEGAGSPAEINIYDRDIANMGAAVIADTDVILVVNVEWGGSFAYALGTIELIPEEDRKRIRGVIFNNLRGKPDGFKTAIPEFERISGVPVIGVVPHADVTLPSEDSEALRGVRGKGEGRCVVGVVRFPRIANFTDLDPLFLEDVSVRFVEKAADLDGVDAVVLPGTKNTINDLKWMDERGISDRIRSLRGRVPIVGICGGYQMMGAVLDDSQGIEGGVPGTVMEGLGLFGNRTEFGEYSKRIVNNTAEMLVGEGGEVTGYELHMGTTEVTERPLFEITNKFTKDRQLEGSVREDEMLFGTYFHGVFDRMPFRRYFLSFVSHDGERVDTSDTRDYDDIVEENIDRLADVFEENIDMDALMRILGVTE